MKIFIPLFFVVLIAGCTSHNSKEDFTAPSRELIGHVMTDQDTSFLINGRGNHMTVINNVVYIFNQWGGYFFTKYDIAAKQSYRFCPQGQGPSEMINAMPGITLVSEEGNNCISVFDRYVGRFLFYNEKQEISDDYRREIFLKNTDGGLFLDAFPINDSIVLARGVFEKNICRFFKHGVAQGAYLESFTKGGNDNMKRIMKDANRFYLSPDKKYIARITQNGGLIEAYKIEGMQLIQQFSHAYFDVICDENLSDTRDSRYGYISASISNEKIYGLYDGGLVMRENMSGSKVVHVYDMEGQLLELLLLDQYVKNIGVNKENTQLYALSEDNDLVLFNL